MCRKSTRTSTSLKRSWRRWFRRGPRVSRHLCLWGRMGLCIKKSLMLVALFVALLAGSACSLDEGKGGEGGVISGASKERAPDRAPKQVTTDGGIGDGVEAGDLFFRIFAVRSRDLIYAISEPGAKPVVRGNISSEYVAIDYVVKNISGSPLTTEAEATLIDDQ